MNWILLAFLMTATGDTPSSYVIDYNLTGSECVELAESLAPTFNSDVVLSCETRIAEKD